MNRYRILGAIALIGGGLCFSPVYLDSAELKAVVRMPPDNIPGSYLEGCYLLQACMLLSQVEEGTLDCAVIFSRRGHYFATWYCGRISSNNDPPNPRVLIMIAGISTR